MYWVDDGCESEGDNTADDITGFYQSKSNTAFVRCCSNDGTTCQTVSNCGNTLDATTYDEAAEECAAIDLRLCTKDELLTHVCCGTGGSCDSAGVWTSTKQTSNF